MKNRGFTLLELSIVIMIIAILTSGMFAYRSWQQSSQLKAVITEYYNYREAVTQFKETYGQLPGDFTNASSFWTSCASPATLCNGNGDGLITKTNVLLTDEAVRAWQMLYLAGLITQNMTGTHTVAGNGQNAIGIDIPISKFPTGGWYFDKNVPGPTVATQANFIAIGAANAAASLNNTPLFTPTQAFNLDQK